MHAWHEEHQFLIVYRQLFLTFLSNEQLPFLFLLFVYVPQELKQPHVQPFLSCNGQYFVPHQAPSGATHLF
jgi:hypothetical protein